MGLFSSSSPKPPIIEQNRIWMEQNFLFLEQEVLGFPVNELKIFTPTREDFPVKFTDSPDTAESVIQIIAPAMNIAVDKIRIQLFSNGIKSFDFGTSILFTRSQNNTESAGTYSQDETGNYVISLDRSILTHGEKLIATLAHELAHVKLLGEKKIEENDEPLTDLATVMFGFGIFNANQSFDFNANHYSWRYSTLGYLPQNEWGYALALLAYCRQEDTPEWLNFLNRQVIADFKNSLKFITSNEDLIFQIPE